MTGVDDHRHATAERLVGLERHDELVLQEPMRPVHPVPLGDDVQRMEELGDVLHLAHPVVRRLAVPELAERLGRGLVDQPVGEDLRHGAQRGGDEPQRVAAPQLGRQIGQPRLAAAGQHRPAQVLAPGYRVEPGDRVGVCVVAGRHRGHQIVEVGAPVGVDDEVGGLGALQGHRCGQHGPGQAHAADGRPEDPLGVGVRRHGPHLTVGHQQVQRDDVVAEAALGVVVLAMHVGGDRPTDGDLAGARQHRDPQAEREQRPHQGVQAHPGLHRDRRRLARRVDGEDPVHLVRSIVVPPAFCAASP